MGKKVHHPIIILAVHVFSLDLTPINLLLTLPE